MVRGNFRATSKKGRTSAGNVQDVKVERLGPVTIYGRGKTYYLYYREDGATRRLRIEGTLAVARATASDVVKALAEQRPSPLTFQQTSPEQLVADYLSFVKEVQKRARKTNERYQDAHEMANLYRDSPEVVLTIDGLQPEKGHETLYVVRELTRQRDWFAEPLLLGATDEIRKLFVRVKELAGPLNLKVVLWVSDKQDAFLKCVAEEFPEVPHRYCENRFFRDPAKPVLELDSTAKKKMRAKIRGLWALEREVLEARQVDSDDTRPASDAVEKTSSQCGESGAVVLDDGSVVRGILNDNHGGPYHPPGVRMLETLADVQQSLERVASSAQADPAFGLLGRLQGFIDRGVADQQETFAQVQTYTDQVRQVMDLQRADDSPPLADREPLFTAKIAEFQRSPDDPICSHLAKVMTAFQSGLFAGVDRTIDPRDNLDLERWFRLPKSHERRIHGHHHASLRIVREGSTLIPALDAHDTPRTQANLAVTIFHPSRRRQHRPANWHRNSDMPSCGKAVPKKRLNLLKELENRICKASS